MRLAVYMCMVAQPKKEPYLIRCPCAGQGTNHAYTVSTQERRTSMTCPKETVLLNCKRPCKYCRDQPGAIGQVPRPDGEHYARNGETVRCPICDGTGFEASTITIDELRERLGC